MPTPEEQTALEAERLRKIVRVMADDLRTLRRLVERLVPPWVQVDKIVEGDPDA